MILHLDDTYRIASDNHNFSLQKDHVTKTGNRKRVTIGYWKDLSGPLKAYSREFLKNQGQCTYHTLLKRLSALDQKIDEIGKACLNKWGSRSPREDRSAA